MPQSDPKSRRSARLIRAFSAEKRAYERWDALRQKALDLLAEEMTASRAAGEPLSLEQAAFALRGAGVQTSRQALSRALRSRGSNGE